MYDKDNGILIFEDGVRYTVKESVLIARSNASPEILAAVHKVKSVFKGTVKSFRYKKTGRIIE